MNRLLKEVLARYVLEVPSSVYAELGSGPYSESIERYSRLHNRLPVFCTPLNFVSAYDLQRLAYALPN